MSTLKSLFSPSSKAALLLLLIAVAMQTEMANSQGCSAQLSNLNVCGPFVAPGATSTSPTADCCTALQSVDHDCLCNTVRIAARLSSQCNLPPVACAN